MVKGHSEGEGAGGGYGNKHLLCTLCLKVHLINGKSVAGNNPPTPLCSGYPNSNALILG